MWGGSVRGGGGGGDTGTTTPPPTCLLCKTKIPPTSSFSSPGGEAPTRSHSSDEETVIAVKMLLRYLNIDVKALFRAVVVVVPVENDDSNNDTEEMWELVVKALCEPCSAVTNKFWQVYQEFEVVRLLLEECVQKVKDQVDVGGGGGDDAPASSAGDTIIEKEDLRTALKRKCALRLVSTPRVVVVEHVCKKVSSSSPPPEDQIIVEEEEEPALTSSSPSLSQLLKPPPEGQMSMPKPVPLTFPNLLSQLLNAKNATESAAVVRSHIPALASEPPKKAEFVEDKPSANNSNTFEQAILFVDLPKPPVDHRIKCSHCAQFSNTPEDHQRHVLCNHPIEFFSDDLPPGTTKQGLENVIQQLLRQCETVDKDGEDHYKCPLCGTLFEGIFEWRVHALETHFESIVELLESGSERKKIPRKQTLSSTNSDEQVSLVPYVSVEVDDQKKGSGGPFPCDHCPKMCSTLGVRRVHLKLVHPYHFYSKRLPPGTSVSSLETTIKNAVKSFSVVRDERGRKRFQCPICLLIIRSKRWDCKRHLLQIHFDDYILPKLGRVNPSSSSDTPTITRVFSQSTKPRPCFRPPGAPGPGRRSTTSRFTPVPCNFCDKVLTDRTCYRAHVMIQHTFQYFSHQLPVTATEEDLEFTLQNMMEEGTLATHVYASATEVYKFKCPICGSHFRRKDNFKVHLLSKLHWPVVLSRLPPTPTQSCSGFLSDEMEQGVVVVELEHEVGEGSEQGKSDKAEFVGNRSAGPTQPCNYCGKLFSTKDSQVHLLTAHAVQHLSKSELIPSGTTEIGLELAIKSVMDKGKVEKRGPAVGDGVRYHCPLCWRVFLRQSALRYHILDLHLEVVKSSLPSQLLDCENEGSITTSGVGGSTQGPGVGVAVPGVCKEEVWLDDDQEQELRPREADDSVVNVEDFMALLGSDEEEDEGDDSHYSTGIDPLGEMETEMDNVPIQSINCGGADQYRCSVCSRVCPSSRSLTLHYHAAHSISTTVTNLTCRFCTEAEEEEGSHYSSVFELHRHEITKHLVHYFSKDVEEWPPATTEPQLRQVLTAQVRWTGEDGGKIFECLHCAKKYKLCYMSWFYFHLRSKHLQTILRDLKKAPGGGAAHQQLEPSVSSELTLDPSPPPQILPPSERPTSSCGYCGKEFIDVSSRNRHLRFQHPLLHFASVLPPNTTQFEWELAVQAVVGRHRYHAGSENPIQCPFCPAPPYATNGDLKVHVTSKHVDKVVEQIKALKGGVSGGGGGEVVYANRADQGMELQYDMMEDDDDANGLHKYC